MATIISTELLHYISPALIFIFIFAILYSVLQKFESFGKSQPINAAIALVGSLLFIIVPVMRDFVSELVPSFIVLLLLVVVILMVLMFMGYKETDIVSYMKENSFGAVVVTVAIIFFIVILGKVVGPVFMQYPAPTELGIIADLKRVIFNPKVLGVAFILVVAGYFVKTIAMPSKQ